MTCAALPVAVPEFPVSSIQHRARDESDVPYPQPGLPEPAGVLRDIILRSWEPDPAAYKWSLEFPNSYQPPRPVFGIDTYS